jgi:hypothetical protein
MTAERGDRFEKLDKAAGLGIPPLIHRIGCRLLWINLCVEFRIGWYARRQQWVISAQPEAERPLFPECPGDAEAAVLPPN